MLTIPIAGHFAATKTGQQWLAEIDATVSAPPAVVTGFVLHAHVVFASEAPAPMATIEVSVADVPRGTGTIVASESFDSAGEFDVASPGTFGGAHGSSDPILIALSATLTDESDVLDVQAIYLDLVYA
jgi:hypothetical protein